MRTVIENPKFQSKIDKLISKNRYYRDVRDHLFWFLARNPDESKYTLIDPKQPEYFIYKMVSEDSIFPSLTIIFKLEEKQVTLLDLRP